MMRLTDPRVKHLRLMAYYNAGPDMFRDVPLSTIELCLETTRAEVERLLEGLHPVIAMPSYYRELQEERLVTRWAELLFWVGVWEGNV